MLSKTVVDENGKRRKTPYSLEEFRLNELETPKGYMKFFTSKEDTPCECVF